MTRRFLPKLSEMTITGYPGREVMVPMLVVNWVIAEEEEESGEAGATRFSDGMLTIVAPRTSAYTAGHNCGFPPSNFL